MVGTSDFLVGSGGPGQIAICMMFPADDVLKNSGSWD